MPVKNSITQLDKRLCTGCLACVQACPGHCISSDYDECGFLYPRIDHEKCISCGRCVSVCPQCTPLELVRPSMAYAAAGRQAEKIAASTSGGIFALLSDCFIKNGDFVCGAVLQEDLTLHHRLAKDADTVNRMRGSKYIQSNLLSALDEVLDSLKQGNRVLFCGTPCQVAAVRALSQNAGNLYTIDLICHGVPSADAFARYVKECMNIKDAVGVTFRDKNKYVSTSFSYVFERRDKNGGLKKQRVFAHNDVFYQAFLDGCSYRESCYTCPYARDMRVGDITIGDCANERAYRQKQLGDVLSTVLINTEKGCQLFDLIKQELNYTHASYEQEVCLNGQLRAPVAREKRRDDFYQDLFFLPTRRLKKKYLPRRSLSDRFKQALIWHIPLALRKKLVALMKK